MELFIHIINELRFEDRFQETESLAALNNKSTLPDRIKALFHFIEFLHANIANFKKYDTTVYDYNSLFIHKYLYLQTPETYQEFLKYISFLKALQAKSEVIYINIIEPIKTKAHSLKVCNWLIQSSVWEINIEDIDKLHKNHQIEDVKIIKEYDQKYAEFRSETNNNYGYSDFFYDLDETFKHLFSFFRDKNDNIQPTKIDYESEDDKSENKTSQPHNNIEPISKCVKDGLHQKQTKKNNLHNHVKNATGFSVLQWATIYYFADDSNLLPDIKIKKEKREAFIKHYNLETTPNYFTKCCHKVNKRLNTTKDYPVDMLKEIILFMKENYKKTVPNIKENIEFLLEEKEERDSYGY